MTTYVMVFDKLICPLTIHIPSTPYTFYLDFGAARFHGVATLLSNTYRWFCVGNVGEEWRSKCGMRPSLCESVFTGFRCEQTAVTIVIGNSSKCDERTELITYIRRLSHRMHVLSLGVVCKSVLNLKFCLYAINLFIISMQSNKNLQKYQN